MANQIGRFFAHEPREKAIASIADHLTKFWDPRMRSEILAHLTAVQLDPLVREAVKSLKTPAGPTPV
jgi:formate dehydrogenase subunit delta